MSISPGSILGEGVGQTILSSVSTVVASEIVVLLAVVTSGTSSSTSDSASSTSLVGVSAGQARPGGAMGVCASETRTTGSVQLTLAQTSGIVAVAGSVIVVTVAGCTRDVMVVAVTLTFADGAETAGGTSTDVLWDTLEGVIALFTTSKCSTLVLELIHGHGRESGGAVVGSLVVVNLMDRNCGVDNIGLNNLLLNNGLNGLMDMVVNVLTANGSSSALAVCSAIYATLILETGLLINEIPLCRIMVAVVKLAVLNGTQLGSVLFGKNLAILDGLDSAVVVVLVDLLINSSLNLLVNMGLHNLMLNSGGNCLVDSSIVMSGLRHEIGDGCLCLVHFDMC